MRRITRARSLQYIGSAFILQACAAMPSGGLRVGVADGDERSVIAEIYALALERANIFVRRVRFADTYALTAASRRGEIDLYAGTVGADGKLDGAVRSAYERRYGITWLAPAPANTGRCIVTSQYDAEKYFMVTLSKCAAIAPRLRLAATGDFVAPGGPLSRLRAVYGGFRFRAVSLCEPGAQYYQLNTGGADVANGVTTSASVGEDQLLVLGDDKRALSQDRSVPVVRVSALHAYHGLAAALNRVSASLTVYALQQMSMRRDLLHMDARDLAADFLDQTAVQAARVSKRSKLRY